MRRSILIGAVAVLSVIGFLGCGSKTEPEAKPKPQAGSQPQAAKLTSDNLSAAWEEEWNAKARYQAFAAKADEEGYKTAAALWRAAANSQDLSRAKHQALSVVGLDPRTEPAKLEVKSTKENLEATVKDKTASVAALPALIKQAQDEKQEKAAMSFMGRKAADEQYLKLFTEAAANPDGWKAGDREFLVCQVCSYVSTDLALKQCPICSAPREKFVSFK